MLQCNWHVCCHLCVGVYRWGSHLVATVDIMGVIVKKDVRDKLIIYGGKCVSFYHESSINKCQQKIYCVVKVVGNCVLTFWQKC